MAPRLTVIVSQSASRDARTIDQEETLVAQLMMTPGLDATLVGPLESVRSDSTDFLCLSSFNHSFCLVSWLDEATAASHWTRLGLSGSVARPGSASAGGAKPRIFHLQLSGTSTTAAVIDMLKRLQHERSVQTVEIALTLPQAKRAQPSQRSVPKPVESQSAAGLEPTGEVVASSSEHQPQDLSEDSQWQQLDRLIEDFEAFEF